MYRDEIQPKEEAPKLLNYMNFILMNTLQGFLFQVPRPLQRLHVLLIIKGPVDTVSMPVPLQLGHLKYIKIKQT